MHIYKTTNNINGTIYIGKNVSECEKYLGSGTLLGIAIRKYGRENFSKEILEENITDKKTLNEREIYWIKYHRDNNFRMYNITKGGDGGWDFTNHPRKEQIYAARGRKKGVPIPNKRRLVSIEGVVYKGVTIAAKELNMPYQTVCCRLNNQKNYAKWFYLDSPKNIQEIGIYGKAAGPSIANIKPYTCPYCNKNGKGNFFRGHHFEKCKSKLITKSNIT